MMDTGESCFQSVCDASDLAAAVASLSDDHLRELVGHCGRECDENSVTGEVLGLALCEAASRFVKQGERRGQDSAANQERTEILG